MPNLTAQLRQYLSPRSLLKVAPLWALAGGASIVLGAALRDPQWAQAGLGALLTAVSANVASSMAYDLIKPEFDDESREALIARGLEQHDPGVIRLVAEALAAAGPDLAQALPDTTRDQLVALLGRGMHESGGALAAIAPRYTSALSTPSTDWPALQAELRRTIQSVAMHMEATEGGVISDSHQQAPHSGGPISQRIVARGPNSRVENSSQVVTGSTAPPTRAQVAHGAAHTPSEPERLHELLARHTQRLYVLEKHAATTGIDTPPHITTEIDEIRAEIAYIKKQLGE